MEQKKALQEILECARIFNKQFIKQDENVTQNDNSAKEIKDECLNKVNEALSASFATLESACLKITEYQKDLQNLRLQIKSKAESSSTMEKEIGILKGQIVMLSTDKYNLQSKIDTLQTENDSLKEL